MAFKVDFLYQLVCFIHGFSQFNFFALTSSLIIVCLT